MKEFDELVEIVEKLRHPKDGCPWDTKQTSRSLIPNFIEELHEAIEAIENDNGEHLSEELGDILLHIVMQAQMAKEEEKFDIKIALKKINEKLIRRHPHIFGNKKKSNAEKVKINWEQIKQKEKRETRNSVLDGIPKTMPALIIAQRLQDKAASVGFDWQTTTPIFAKLKEEIDEFMEAFEQNNLPEMQSELGDILFVLVNLARKLGFDAESSIKLTNNKFERRFKKIERSLKNNNEDIYQTNLERLDELWNLTKKDEK